MKNKIFFYSFLTIWAIIIFLNVFKPNTKFSERENRSLATFPKFTFEKLIDGSYATGIDTYINDHFVFRDYFMNIKTTSDILCMKDEINKIYIGKDGYLFENFTYSTKDKENIEKITTIVDDFANKIDIPTYFMLIPNSIYINQDKLPENVIVPSQNDIINNMYNNMKNVINIDVTKILENNKSKDLYFKTDHHMTSLGAYLLYTQLCKSLNMVPVDISTMQKRLVANNFLGTFDSKLNSPFTKPDNIEIYLNDQNKKLESVEYDNETTQSIFNTKYLNSKDKYSFFLNGNNAKVVVKTKIKNNKKILILKDSYAHIMIQFLCNNYEEIHLLDPRYYKASTSEYVKNNNIDEVLFLYNVSNIINDLGLRTLK